VMITGSPSISGSVNWNVSSRISKLLVVFFGCSTVFAPPSLSFQLDPNIDVSFSRPFFYDGVGVGGHPDIIDNCAAHETTLQNNLRCRNLRLCVVLGSSAYEVAQQRLHPTQIVETTDLDDLYRRFGAGCCNLMATDFHMDRTEALVRFKGNYTGPYKLGPSLYTKEPVVAATRKHTSVHLSQNDNETIPADEDPNVWSGFVSWVIESLIAAEEKNITQFTAIDFPQTDVFGSEYQDMFRHAIRAVGNYGDIWNHTLEDVIPRIGMNRLHTGNTGLHFSQSIGDVSRDGDAPMENSTLSAVVKRGKLLCGIPLSERIVPSSRRSGRELYTGAPPLSNSTSASVFHSQNHTIIEDVLTEEFGVTFSSQNDTDIEVFLTEELGVTFSNGTLARPNATLVTTASIDIEFCRAVTAAIFRGQFELQDWQESCSAQNNSTSPTFDADTFTADRPTLEIVLLTDLEDGYSKLQNGEIDIIAGYKFNLENDVNEATTGQGYSFSQPYFFSPPPENGQITE